MAIKTHDTDPRFSSGRVREIMRLEAEIDKLLLSELRDGRCTVHVTVTDKESLDILLARYKKNNWTVIPTAIQPNEYKLRFEDSSQLEPTRRLTPLRMEAVKPPVK